MPARYRILLSPRASADLTGVYQYIAKDSPRNAAAVIAELIDAVDSLQILPQRHAIYRGRGRPAVEVVRRMPVPPHLIYYRVNEADALVEIITIRHGKRRQPRGFT
jgi:plasmid stabilization system protein ParE